MRLIDADELILHLNDYALQEAPFRGESADTYNAIENCIKAVEEQPTSYDIGKVVKELEERTDFLKNYKKYGNKNAKQQAESYSAMMMYEIADLVDDLIEIVKQGGVADDVCEWKSVSDGEFIQNPHTKRLYSNEPSMKNVYCNTCGKNIRIVGD